MLSIVYFQNLVVNRFYVYDCNLKIDKILYKLNELLKYQMHT